jgi:hypothetical protein
MGKGLAILAVTDNPGTVRWIDLDSATFDLSTTALKYQVVHYLAPCDVSGSFAALRAESFSGLVLSIDHFRRAVSRVHAI